MLLGASRRELLAVLGGKAPTNISNLVTGARQRQDLRRHTLGPEEGEELAQIRDPDERKTRRRYLIALGRGVDSTFDEERARILSALESAKPAEP
jgi:hypothetical protein